MNCFHFGESDRRLFGVYSPPAVAPKDMAVLLCYPFGQEYMRAHMAFRQLANLLSRRGVPVMRFDYFGTGDSYGEADEISFSIWQENTQLAIDELTNLSGCSRVCLVGLRVGATVAATVASLREDIDGLVLWDPVIKGANYLHQVNQENHSIPPQEDWQVHGYPLPTSFGLELFDIDLEKISFANHLKIFHIVSSENDEFEPFDSPGVEKLEYKLVQCLGNWNYSDHVGAILLPHKLIRAIVDWLA